MHIHTSQYPNHRTRVCFSFFSTKEPLNVYFNIFHCVCVRALMCPHSLSVENFFLHRNKRRHLFCCPHFTKKKRARMSFLPPPSILILFASPMKKQCI